MHSCVILSLNVKKSLTVLLLAAKYSRAQNSRGPTLFGDACAVLHSSLNAHGDDPGTSWTVWCPGWPGWGVPFQDPT